MALFTEGRITLTVKQALTVAIAGAGFIASMWWVPVMISDALRMPSANAEEIASNGKKIRSLQEIMDSLTKLHEERAAEEKARRQTIRRLCHAGKLDKRSAECLEVME